MGEAGPDFERFKAVLLGQVRDWVPPAELGIDLEVKEAFLGRPISSPADEVAFWQAAGYDYVIGRIWEPPGALAPFDWSCPEVAVSHRDTYSVYGDRQAERSWAREGKGQVTTWQEFESFPWPTADMGGHDLLTEIGNCLPPGMKLIVAEGRIFHSTWMLMGFESFAYNLVENPELVGAVFQKVAELRYQAFCRAIELPAVGAHALGDDIAYATGLLVSPQVLRQHVFPWYRKFGEICRQLGKPLIYHSDGKLFEVLDDLIACGVNALHPIEPKAMDAPEVKRRTGGRLTLVGNIELDRLARGTPDEVRELTRERIELVGTGGGYCAGSSNSVTHYVPLENFRAMIETIRDYG